MKPPDHHPNQLIKKGSIMTYFRDKARTLGCDVDDLGDLAVWLFLRGFNVQEKE